jgi:hypothetical protein
MQRFCLEFFQGHLLTTIHLQGVAMSINNAKQLLKRTISQIDPRELTLDIANEMSFPASDPIATSNIQRIEIAPDMSPANADHQISGVVKVIYNTPENYQTPRSGEQKVYPWAFSAWLFMGFRETK